MKLTEQERWARLRTKFYKYTQYRHTARTNETEIRVSGILLGSKLEVLSKGKPQSIHYCITEEGIKESNP